MHETRFSQPPEVQTIRNPNPTVIEAYLSKSWIEVQNGLVANMLIIEANKNELKLFHETVENIILKLKSATKWLITCFCCIADKKIFVCSFHSLTYTYKDSKMLLASRPDVNDYQGQSILQKATTLYSLLTDENPLHEREIFLPLLRREAEGNVSVLAALASEILLVWGEPALPTQFIFSKTCPARASSRYGDENYQIEKVNNQKTKKTATFPESFEDRINVSAYNYFELVHPSYARQSVALANQVAKAAVANRKCLDIGTGPGAALLMQNELLPDYHFTAIEPSAVAYNYLAANVEKNAHITALNVDFLQYETDQHYDLILSTGASHHLNTYSFFQKASQLLTKNGAFIVADEMISPYSTNTQRKLNVMIHHSVYILELMIRLRSVIMDTLECKEKMLCSLLCNYLPIAFVYAKLSFVNEAEQIYKNLLHQLNKLALDMNVSSPFVAFYRLMHLELEALVAGIDYEVEQKTYPEMFMRLANFTQLKCIYHECVHNTSGISDLFSGTHVFTFTH